MPTSGRHIFAFGSGESGRLGFNTTDNIAQPRPISPFSQHRIIQIVTGAAHSMALTEQGQVYAWGANSSGQLGVGDFDSALAPMRIKAFSDKKIVFIAAGDSHSAAVTSEGDLYTWGSGGHIVKGIGGLGLGPSKTNVNTPTLVEALKGVKVYQVACGGSHSGAIADNGEVYTWGKGDWGRLGHGDTFNCPLPKKLDFLNLEVEKPVKLDLGRNYSALLTDQGNLYMFGKNEHFQLGLESAGNLIGGGNFDGEKRPTLVKYFQIANERVRDVSCGDFFTVATTDKGSAYMWGKGFFEISNLRSIKDKIVSLSSGRNHAGYLAETGQLYMVGSSQYGETGEKGSIFRSTQNVHPISKKLIPGKVVQVSCGTNYTLALVDMDNQQESIKQ